MTISPDTLAALRDCRTALAAARQSILSAATGLSGVRQARATQLAERLADDISFADRLWFVVQGDAGAT
ncbi:MULTISPECIES: hypothetical protein [Mycobacterium]|uniref:hypothetical protein n=1 Tax=Mycobacterium TaxID=1763 RepID=UPI001CD957F4|nr:MULTISPECIES: hypothetical protein [Mycobacterium]MCA2245343.1 hypothetical protein [Mycobacterium sp. WUMAC-067]MCA2316300.1 hypothetical protein [Mycobacterium sp. WUMAC-025]MEE3751186.1 hypothetical protein [Mycobacterium intracellulare]